jgi:hypothetical protein
MSTPPVPNVLDEFKKSRIEKVTREANLTINRLYINAVNSIMQLSRSRSFNRNALINNVIRTYNHNVGTIKRELNNEIRRINQITTYNFEHNSTTVQNKKALLIGINYTGTPYQLNGCIDDSNRMREFLTTYGFSQFTMLNDNTPVVATKQNILNEFVKMLTEANENDVLFFYFSGHGSYMLDHNNDEEDGRDEMIVSVDMQGILDDELKQLLNVHMKPNVTVIGLFDSCHSGTMLDLKYSYLNSNNYTEHTENVKATEVNGNVIMLSGCQDEQTSYEAIINAKPQGAVTWAFISAMQQNVNLSWRELLVSMREILSQNQFTQIPQMSTDSLYNIDQKLFL